MNRIALLMALLVLVGGCATGVARMKTETPVTRYQPYLGTPIERFTAFRFDGWELVGHNQVVVWTGVNEAYLLTVWDSCQDLEYAERVGLSSTGHTVSRLESLSVGQQRCPIESIRPIDIGRYKADSAGLRQKN
jgi:hypothetical protein